MTGEKKTRAHLLETLCGAVRSGSHDVPTLVWVRSYPTGAVNLAAALYERPALLARALIPPALAWVTSLAWAADCLGRTFPVCVEGLGKWLLGGAAERGADSAFVEVARGEITYALLRDGDRLGEGSVSLPAEAEDGLGARRRLANRHERRVAYYRLMERLVKDWAGRRPACSAEEAVREREQYVALVEALSLARPQDAEDAIDWGSAPGSDPTLQRAVHYHRALTRG